jgi:hypothetical protein
LSSSTITLLDNRLMLLPSIQTFLNRHHCVSGCSVTALPCCFLERHVISVAQDRVKVHKVKSAGKDALERRRAWDLEDLKMIDGVSEQSVG